MAVNDYQVGGSHYSGEYQHWDFVCDTGLHYLPATASKYVSRWRRKNGVEDLSKALHYLEKAEERGIGPCPDDKAEFLAEFGMAQRLTPREIAAIFFMLVGKFREAATMVAYLKNHAPPLERPLMQHPHKGGEEWR